MNLFGTWAFGAAAELILHHLTFLQVLKVDAYNFRVVEEDVIGTDIPIVSLDKYREMNPDYLLVLPYQYINEIAKQEKDFLEKGGKMIIPLPHPRIIDSSYLLSLKDTDYTVFTPGYDQF